MPEIDSKVRCSWCGTDPLYVEYHDHEWGVALHDDRRLFELLVLEGFQAGLSWITILRKRENFRRAFCEFDAERIAAFTQHDLERLMGDAGIIRNKLKIESSVLNARAYLGIRGSGQSFDRFLWQFTGFKTVRGHAQTKTAESDAMSKELLRHGFKFAGSTICHAPFMQASGMVHDHAPECFLAGLLS